MRVNVNLPDEIVTMIDLYAKKNGISRTVAMTFLLSEKLTDEIRKAQIGQADRLAEEGNYNEK